MKTTLLTAGIALIVILRAGWAGIPADEPGPAGVKPFDWNKHGPFEFIAYLIRQDERGVKTVRVEDAPKDWLKREHIELLVQLLDSNEPCASVGSTRSSIIDFQDQDQKSSTVGHEAAYLIESYRHGLFPKYAVNTSADVKLDQQQLKRWWSVERGR